VLGLGWSVTVGPLAAPVLAVPGRSAAAAASAPQVTDAGRGADLFQASCAACHGPGGAGTENGPDIRNAGAAGADFQLRTGRMPLPQPNEPVRRPQPAFSEQDIEDLVAHVASLGVGPPIPDVQVDAASDTAAGRAAYVATCAACHGAGASGDAVGGGAIAPQLHDVAPTQVGEAIRTGPGAMPRFGPDQVSDEQLGEIAAYLQYLHRDAAPGGASLGGVGPVVEGYVGWIVYLVALVGLTRWIERRRHRG
jgi:ubiquinol-cytochrome c reductase cytochrome c subunit